MERTEPFKIEDLEQKYNAREKKNVCIFFCKKEEGINGIETEKMTLEEIDEYPDRIQIVDKRNQHLMERRKILERLELSDVRTEIASQAPVGILRTNLLEVELEPIPESDIRNEKSRVQLRVNIAESIITEEEEEEEKIEEQPEESEPEPEPEEEEIPRKRRNILVEKKGKKTKEGEKKNKEEQERERERQSIYAIKLDTVKLGDKMISKRLPEKRRFAMRTSNFYMNNRKMYIQKLSQIFRPYRDEILQKIDSITCDTIRNMKVDFDLLTHQKVVRDYLNLFTPYRGILLYHSLGSGKSCSSIAIAEGMKSQKQIILMTPASLKMNFFKELKKCGDPLYRLNQYWEFVKIDGNPDLVFALAKSLSLPTEYIREHGGAWMVDVTKPANIGQLNANDQSSLNEQIDAMIRTKYLDINYNGMNKKKLRELTENGKVNPFDHSVVIIDEAHNFVSRIVNKLKVKSSISYQLYNYLMDATDVRIVLVSGTPIINYPNEIGVLYNILRGYIKTWIFNVQTTTTQKVNRDYILDVFRKAGINTVDYVEYSGNVLQITRNPFGFVNTYSGLKNKNNVKKGGHNDRSNDIDNNKNKSKKTNHTPNKIKNKTRKNTSMNLQKEEDISAGIYKINKDGVIQLNKSNASIENEINPEETMDYHYQHMENMYKGGMQMHTGGMNEFEEYTGITLDETGNISDVDFQKQIIRVLENAGIHVIIPDAGKLKQNAREEAKEKKMALLENAEKDVEIEKITIIPPVKYKALPDNSKQFLEMFIDINTGDMTNIDVFKRRILGLTSYYRSSQEQLMPTIIKTSRNETYDKILVPMSDFQFAYYYKFRKEERDKDKKRKKTTVEDDLKISSTYRIRSRSACNFAFPNEHPRPMPDKDNITEDELNAVTKEIRRNADDYMDDANDDEDNIVKKKGKDTEENNDDDDDNEPTREYIQRIQDTLDALKYDPLHPRPKEFLTKEGLEIYSPKFLRILENIEDTSNEGLHMLYSQFRTVEGIGLFKMVLEATGYAQLKIKKVGEEWQLDIAPEDEDKPKFMLYTGTEEKEEKEIMLNIYNSTWDYVPQELANKLKEKHADNKRGELVRIIMITSSGAEGINLRNTRFVHIMEPYWNIVRMEQVIGRARRICSHQDLPEEMRNVKVYVYQSVFTDLQKKDKNNVELMAGDISRIDNKSPVTTDQYMFEVAQIKNKVNSQILKAIKETAMDCSVYAGTNKDENLVCYGFGRVTSNAFGTYPNLELDKEERTETTRKFQARIITDTKTGIQYALNEKTGEIYDLDSYYSENGQLLLVGNLVKSDIKVDGKRKTVMDIKFL